MKNLIIISFLFLLCGCSAPYYQAKDIKKQHQLNYQYQGELAKDCATLFPVKDSVGAPIYTPANNINYAHIIDSVKKAEDSLYTLASKLPLLWDDTAKMRHSVALLTNMVKAQAGKINALQSAYKPCKPDTMKMPIYITDMAKLKVLQDAYKVKADSLATVKHDLAASKKSRSILMWILIGIISLASIFIIAKVVIFFYGGGWANTIKKVI